MSGLRLKLILLFRSVPKDDVQLRELLQRFGLISLPPPASAAPVTMSPQKQEEKTRAAQGIPPSRQRPVTARRGEFMTRTEK
jgi:hypothetical protein